ncbi:MAG TPA: c-type cytochrome, partial [Polyangiaceae bacterium]|nr:c-type cytochrome [Polyangiaceae bacterium]
MIRSPVVQIALVVLGCVVSGTLECAQVPLAANEEHGRELYGRMCAVCHGRAGEGYAADHATALAHPDFLSSVSDSYLRTAITYGRTGTTMSAWATTLGGPLHGEDVDALVAYVRTWQKTPSLVLDQRPLAGDSDRGRPLFVRECAVCHGADGRGGPEVHIGNHDLLESASNGFLRYAITRGRSGTKMPAFGPNLGEGGVEDLIAALRGLPPASRMPPRPTWPPARVPPIPLGPVPLHPHGPEPVGFRGQGQTTSAETVKGQLDRGARMAILDARAPSDYANEHIAGAVSVPFYDPEPYVASLPRDAWLVCYCSCPHAESGQLAAKLDAKGFKKVTVLD